MDDYEEMIVKMQFGSHVYGTNVPTSDLDYKGVYMPTADNILMQRAKGGNQQHTKKNPDDKNTENDVDIEHFSLLKYINLLLEGQTVCLDMLFTPEEFILEKTELWDYIRGNKHKFLHSGVSAFAGYCRTQANKYGIKGSRMKAVQTALEYLNKQADFIRLETLLTCDMNADYSNGLNHLAEKHEHIDMTTVWSKRHQAHIPYFEVVGRKFELRLRVKEARSRLQKIWDEYGKRAKAAMNNEGIDWKALMHAVRVQEEAKELLTTGHITFPRPEADLLLAIRKAEMPYADVAKIIEDGLDELDKVESILPSKPSYLFAENLIKNEHAFIVRTSNYYGT